MAIFNHNHIPIEGQTILLTGGSEGTGLCAARIFSRKGANVIIVSRSHVKLEEAVQSIKAPEIVRCLAGLSTSMFWTDDNTLEAARHNMDVDYSGSAEMSRAIMRAWLLPGQGKQQQSSTPTRRPTPKDITFNGSVLSTFSPAGHGTYCPSKFTLRALADALAMEARLYPDVPIEVHLVMPNSITTAGYERENETKPAIIDPEVVARLAIEGMEKGRYFITTSFLGDLMPWGAMNDLPRNNWAR
ncbi:3-ketodihydrosphingosine reductase tsc-10 [Xylaria arbuscula]|nr:3-ketodihydrosphingosine reductase tsc-10 [Xylaria arbuscula]